MNSDGDHDFRPNCMKFAEFKQKIINNIDGYKGFIDSLPSHLKSETDEEATFPEWMIMFGEWMENGAPDTYEE